MWKEEIYRERLSDPRHQSFYPNTPSQKRFGRNASSVRRNECTECHKMWGKCGRELGGMRRSKTQSARQKGCARHGSHFAHGSLQTRTLLESKAHLQNTRVMFGVLAGYANFFFSSEKRLTQGFSFFCASIRMQKRTKVTREKRAYAWRLLHTQKSQLTTAVAKLNHLKSTPVSLLGPSLPALPNKLSMMKRFKCAVTMVLQVIRINKKTLKIERIPSFLSFSYVDLAHA